MPASPPLTEKSLSDNPSQGDPAEKGPFEDRLLMAGVIIWILAILPSFLPILPRELTLDYADQYSDVPGLLMVLAATMWAMRVALLKRERMFWCLIGASAVSMLGVRIIFATLPEAVWGTPAADLAQDSFYVLSYLLLVFALEHRPDRVTAPGFRAQLRVIEILSGFVFLFGLVTYFVFLPSVLAPDDYMSWVPSLTMFVVFDVYVVVRLAMILRGRVGPGWRPAFVWLTAAYGTWLVGDVVETLMYLDIVPLTEPGTPPDILWHFPTVFLLLAVRSRGWSATGQDVEYEEQPTKGIETLVPERTGMAVLAMSLPAIHFGLGGLGIRQTELDGPREWVVLLAIVVLAGLLLRHHHLMRRIAHSIEADRQLVSDQLHTSQRMEAVGRLATGVAHDFSNILSVIRGRAELLMMTGHVLESGREDAEEIVEASRRGQSLVSHLLTLGRRQASEAEVFDLSQVIGDMRPLVERVLPDSVAVIFNTGEGSLPVVHADRAHLEQVVLNLVVNARDAMPDGGTLRIRAEVRDVDDQFAVVHGGSRGGEYTVLSVADTGPGVAPELRHLIFEPFFTTKDQDLGTGLGLSIVYGVARQVQGFVRITDAPGGGALFEVFLPKAQKAPQAPRASEIRTAGAKGRETILLVEDYEALRKTAMRVLQEAGFRVLQAGTAAEALAILERRNENVELLIADIVLPDLSGFELDKRARERLPELVTVFITGYANTVAPLQLPEDATILEKPFSPEVLTFTVRRVLDERTRLTV